ncbi:HPr-rel-A system PqqD family peptide chaperone [Algoriphagus formosus]|uniref:HPr-rel-A system PqqD family peptide chaperone n=1 Tax=Algoriphagus formosus TaxID=2007308 RepID=A0A4R5UW46_9BACT|nr:MULTISPECIES: HPr-rel-A system PqqD family peptide chaperone [Algoriphagus]TDK43462.1 HPr-rel-A system PqqD family peptide chaperone [Algoriphagus aquimaris]
MLKLKSNVAISESGFVFDAGAGDSFSLNATGLEIVQLIQAGKDFPEILQILSEKYEVDPESFERYFYDFVATLKQMNLIEQDGED